MAWEDIGLADPRAMQIANDAAQTFERLGSPEGELALAQATIYLAVAAKSNAGYNAYNQAMAFVKRDQSRPVPVHLRNAPTKLMKELGYGHADEQLFSLVFFDNHDIFDVYYGDYQEMIVNYVEPRERPGEPLRLLIAHSFAAGDYAVCEKGCEAVWKAFKRGNAELSSDQLGLLIRTYKKCLEQLGKECILP
jgi:hypothetical protein